MKFIMINNKIDNLLFDLLLTQAIKEKNLIYLNSLPSESELAGNEPSKEEIVELKNDNGETKKFVMQQYTYDQLLSTNLYTTTGVVEQEYVTTFIGLLKPLSGGGTIYDDPLYV